MRSDLRIHSLASPHIARRRAPRSISGALIAIGLAAGPAFAGADERKTAAAATDHASVVASGDVRHAAESFRQHGTSLTKVIAVAEKHCGGQAVEARCRPAAAGGPVFVEITCLDRDGRVVLVTVDPSTGEVAHARAVDARATGDGGAIAKATELRGREVLDGSGATIGKIDELAVDLADHRVAFVVIRLSEGRDRMVAVPWSAMAHGAHGPRGEKTCRIEPRQGARGLAAAPTFERGAWPDMTREDFAARTREAFGEPTAREEAVRGRTPSRIVRATEVLGADVRNNADENLGSVEDLAIATHSGELRYVVLSFGGFLGFNDKLFAVPPAAFAPGRDGTWVLPVSKDRLKDAPGFDKKAWPDMANPAFADSMRGFYGESSRRSAR
ncbi:MAG TPA: PRC-barrel domain-containing protein [Phycisphaerales bacterium]|nr:PRC-barrel domain-containing protein [Phycisphaerales bacterium]HMP37376.1 PRC-barrel domain-containing protein [Phycisphaerales bacterium]